MLLHSATKGTKCLRCDQAGEERTSENIRLEKVSFASLCTSGVQGVRWLYCNVVVNGDLFKAE
eukprot:2005806-Amphidinium_carterae.1